MQWVPCLAQQVHTHRFTKIRPSFPSSLSFLASTLQELPSVWIAVRIAGVCLKVGGSCAQPELALDDVGESPQARCHCIAWGGFAISLCHSSLREGQRKIKEIHS